jgi:hypothetical protein
VEGVKLEVSANVFVALKSSVSENFSETTNSTVAWKHVVSLNKSDGVICSDGVSGSVFQKSLVAKKVGDRVKMAVSGKSTEGVKIDVLLNIWVGVNTGVFENGEVCANEPVDWNLFDSVNLGETVEAKVFWKSEESLTKFVGLDDSSLFEEFDASLDDNARSFLSFCPVKPASGKLSSPLSLALQVAVRSIANARCICDS